MSLWDMQEKDLRNREFLEVYNTHLTLRDFMASNIEFHSYDHLSFNPLFYQAGSLGIEPHQDYSYNKNYIAIYIITGSNSFFTAKDKSKTDEIEFPTKPGDLILMRAPRIEGDDGLRPTHYVDQVLEDRLVLTIREINSSEIKSKKYSKYFK